METKGLTELLSQHTLQTPFSNRSFTVSESNHVIRFRKTLSYPLTPTSGDTFHYLNDVTEQRIDPPSLQPGALEIPSFTLLHSPLKRVVDSFAPPVSQQRISLDTLREVPFSLAALCTPVEWRAQRSAIVRRRFVDAFVQDSLLSSREKLQQELYSILHQSTLYPDVTVVSHSFRLKLLQAYVGAGCELFRQPERLVEWISPEQKTFQWG